MLIFPAIDLMGGQVVRLRQGKAAEKTVANAEFLRKCLASLKAAMPER